MIPVKNNYEYVNDILSKNSGEGVFPDEYNRVANSAQKEYYKLVLGSNNRTVNGQSRVVYGRNQILDARLEPFRKTALIPVVNNIVTIPTDCAHITTVRTPLDSYAIRRIDIDRVGMVNRDPLAKPNEEDRYYLEGDGIIELFTEDSLANIRLNYLAYPTPVKYAYTNTGERGRPVYDPVNSVDFEWNELEEQEITIRILQRFGVEFRDGHLQNYTNIAKSQE